MAIKEGISEDSRDDMLEEAKAMIKVPTHEHIVNFHGISMHENQVYVLLEFCSMGSLDKYLRKHKENLTVKLEHGDYEEVVNWCVQVADAMEFLAKPENNIIHVRVLELFPNNAFIFDSIVYPEQL